MPVLFRKEEEKVERAGSQPICGVRGEKRKREEKEGRENVTKKSRGCLRIELILTTSLPSTVLGKKKEEGRKEESVGTHGAVKPLS